jgi:hypothetical protein
MVTSVVERAWSEQGSWSQVANRLKRNLERKRTVALGLTIAGAIMSAAAVAVGLGSGGGKVLAFASATSVGLAGLVVRGSASELCRSGHGRARCPRRLSPRCTCTLPA